MIKKLTPILYVEEIEPAIPFWTALGFEKTAEVMEADRLGFVILAGRVASVHAQLRTDLPLPLRRPTAARAAAAPP